MPEQGLAQSLMDQGQASAVSSLEEVMQMLMQGMEPEQLVQMGIPQELVMQAMEQLTAKMQPQQPAMNPQQEGLAGMQLPQVQ